MSFRPARLLAALALALAFAALAGCSKSDSTSPTPPVTGPTFSFSFPSTGTSNQLTFTDVGSWGYHCIAHGSAGMVGTVNVLAATTPPTIDSAVVQVGAGGLAFNPNTVTIHSGGHVRWVNVSALPNHTVTRP